MKNLTKLTLAAIAALALVTAAAFACDHDKTAQTGAQAKSGCQHGTADQAKAGCSHEGEAAGAGGCNHGAKAEVADYKDSAGGCPFHSKATDAQLAALQKGGEVTLVGRVVCANCDLKQTKECKSMFKTENGDLYAIVGNDAFEKLAVETKHGEKKVEIIGTAAKDANEPIVLLSSYKLLG